MHDEQPVQGLLQWPSHGESLALCGAASVTQACLKERQVPSSSDFMSFFSLKDSHSRFHLL